MTNTSIEAIVTKQAYQAKQAARVLAHVPTEVKNQILLKLADALKQHEKEILTANAIDLQQAEQTGLSSALPDRLKLTPARLQGMARSAAGYC